ncbi:hypothetical protein L873DRAFT_1677022 [Choiromyces venosus 120613-1]|uniref:Uncharacterized protein n=1 Tax=Choiromyces venosus 120613-1 TaxID=1336337 RepID=A0A3N4JSI9_9PEZI|nr:hypothetical protein L873DRAFT_1677022 [Choiromyces venosus 120613-1]
MSYLTSTYANQRHTVHLLNYSLHGPTLAHLSISSFHDERKKIKYARLKQPQKNHTSSTSSRFHSPPRMRTVPAYLETPATLCTDIIRLC